MSDSDLALTTEERALVKAREKAAALKARRRRFHAGLFVVGLGVNLCAAIPAFVSLGIVGALTAIGSVSGLALVVLGLEIGGAFDP